MDRKNFIKVSSLSLAGLLVTDFAIGGNRKGPVLQLPDTIEILAGDAYFPLLSSDLSTWKYKDVIVECKTVNGSIRVYVQSPTFSLQEIKISWKY